MGDEITRPARPADHLRVKFLREALQNSTPALSLSTKAIVAVSEEVPSSFAAENHALQTAYLEQLIEGAPEAISILDTDLRITRLNGEFTRMFGFSPEEALGRPLESLIVPPDRTAETRWIQETLAKGEKVVLETKRQRKDGTLVDVFVSCAPVVVAGERVGVYALYRDISEQKRAEALSSALLRIAEKAGSAEDLQQFYTAIHGIVAELMYARNLYIAL